MRGSFTALALVLSVNSAFAQSAAWDNVKNAAGTSGEDGTTFAVVFIPEAGCQATFSLGVPVGVRLDTIRMSVSTSNPADPVWVCRTKEMVGTVTTLIYCEGYLSERAFRDIMGSRRVAVRMDYLDGAVTYDQFTLDGSRKAIGAAAVACFEADQKETIKHRSDEVSM